MTFIITFISLIIERYFHWTQLRHWRWFDPYQSWIEKRLKWSSYIVIAASILPLLIIVSVVYGLLDGFWYGSLKIIFGCFVLVYCMGPSNLWVQTLSCLEALHKSDPKAAIDCAHASFGMTAPRDSQGFHQSLTSAIFTEVNQRVFAVLFWFAILGPVGAVLYRSISLCAKQANSGVMELAIQLQRTLDWIPVRLLTFIFALGGHFIDVFTLWKRDVKKGNDVNDMLLTECGVAALDMRQGSHLPEDGSLEKSALELIDRVLIMWMIVLAVVVLIVK